MKILKKGAVPSVFPNIPAYLSSSTPDPRSESSTSSARREKSANRMEKAAEQFLKEDDIECLVGFTTKNRSILHSVGDNRGVSK
jgi:hypothetical protein